MTRDVRSYAEGTCLVTRMPWATYLGGRALCPDGKVRALKRIALCADTFFSVPAAVSYKGKTVAGFVTVTTREGYDTPTDDDPAIVKFVPYTYRKNGGLFS